jgi:hypothetical protein
MKSFKSGLPSSHRCCKAVVLRLGRLELDTEDIVPCPIISLLRFFTAAKGSTLFSICLFQRLTYDVTGRSLLSFLPIVT